MNDLIQDLLSAASSDSMITFKEKLFSILNQKVKDSIEMKKQDVAQNLIATEETIEEKIAKSTSVEEIIDDIVHSDDPKFDGKSKKERIQIALGIYYNLHPEKKK